MGLDIGAVRPVADYKDWCRRERAAQTGAEIDAVYAEMVSAPEEPFAGLPWPHAGVEIGALAYAALDLLEMGGGDSEGEYYTAETVRQAHAALVANTPPLDRNQRDMLPWLAICAQQGYAIKVDP